MPPPKAPRRASKSSASEASWQRALRLLAARDRSEAEVRARLQTGEVSRKDIEAAISRLKQLHYLDDERFALTHAQAAARRGHGSQRVSAELESRGVSSALIAAALAAAFADESALARTALARRFKQQPQDAGERARAARFLLSRGFPEDLVLAILGEGC